AALRADELGSARSVVHVVEGAAPGTAGDFLLLTPEDLQEAVTGEVVLAEENLPEEKRRRLSACGALLLLAEAFAELLRSHVPQAQSDLPEEPAPPGVGGDAIEPRPLNADNARNFVRSQVALLDQDLAQR